jgi:class 3 adenylate cyclase
MPDAQEHIPDELRSQRKILLTGLAASGLVSLLWGLSYTLLGLGRASWVGYGAAALNLLLLAAFFRTRAYRLLLFIHCSANLLLPFAAEALLGGMQRSGCLGLWAVVGPLTVLIHEMPGPWVWFAAFLALQMGSIATDPYWAAHAAVLDPNLSRVFLFSNVVGVFSILFFPLRYVDHLRRQLKETVKQQSMALAMEHANSERLILNILPESVARKLKAKEGMVVDAYPDASVLFADIAGFTRFSSGLPAGELVDLLNGIFCLFDALAEEYGLEKIKTIGDAYMVVGNVPAPVDQHLVVMAEMALSMQAVFQAHAATDLGLGLRLGLHSGPVVAGVIGTKKFSFDLWGDTVNIASRMESHGEPGRIQVSQAVYERLKGEYLFEERGAIELRGRGAMKTWWLQGRRPGSVFRQQKAEIRSLPQFI